MTSPLRSPARSLTLSLLALAALASCARPAPAPPAAAPAPPPAAAAAAPAASQMFVVAANPLASEAGMAVLRRGGSAVDAAIAVQAMLSLVEPQSSGIGGGAFLNYFNAATGKAEIYDGRETAPAGASPDMFIGDTGKPLGYPAAVTSGRATGVPGVVRMLKLAHEEHGSLEWRTLFGDAERTARDGFIVSPRLGRFLTRSFPQLASPDAQAYFAEADGSLVDVGDRLKNPAYSAFLARLAAQGPDALYAGPTAQAIVARTNAAPLGGTMTLADLTAYRPVKREPLCRDWRVYLVCVPPPPSSGVGMLQLLLMLERTDIASRNAQDPQAWFLFAEASRIMYADRDRYVGDPLTGTVPVEGLLAPDYIARRAALIGTVAGAPPAAGTPAGAVVAAADTTAEPAGTSHFIVGDSKGNVVSMTTTVESIFGTGRMVDGFFLNNQMTDFAFSPRDAQGRAAVNAVAPGKRPRSSMTPLVMIDRQGRFAGALGSAGGNAILAYVGKSMIGAVDWGLPMQQALALPNVVARGDNFGGEVTRFSPQILEALAARGMKIEPGQGEDSGLHGVIVRDGRIDGGYDPRREGRVLVEAGRR
ncbi:gamma-glutamyltransferase family protein [Sphingomonas sp. S1-29]|uniref:gamma-glutamyltransferase family protein n=1 Tax=Sphingomonas sp. S1-29 TaxID=2991074 RepID=UPI00223FCC32|nr:gamma-glutamyltransferase family protein [Sphingomonas sp. S1-29]UZK69168.1 gamma-glutamyltransferase family protein [Sphingomonas sp. S1-29]